MTIAIRAKHSKTIFPSDTYQVAVFKTIEGHDKSSFTASGNFPKLTSREEIILEGEFKETPKYGLQFHVESWKRPVPTSKEQLISFFSSSLFKGVGKKMAERIVDTLGKQAIKRISKDSLCLLEVESMKKETADLIALQVQRTFLLNELIEQYGKYGVSSEILLRAYAVMGLRINELHDNPYLFAQHNLLYFATVDEIGLKMGILPHSFKRLDTVIRIGLKEFISKQGHCYLEEKDFIHKCLFVLNQKVKQADQVIDRELIQAMEQSKACYLQNGLVYPTNLYFAEKDVAKAVNLLTKAQSNYDADKINQAISAFEKENNIILDMKQKQTPHELFKHNVLILTGGPGTGKTFTVNCVLDIYKRLIPNADIALAAPTGRAAKKLGEVTGMGKHALTIHRLLGIGMLGSDKPMFTEDLQLPYKLLIVDEYSMADIELSSMLFKAIEPGTKVLIVGDPDQLPSVKAGNVLKDLLDAGIPHVQLTKIFRQAQQSNIVKMAHSINKGEEISFENTHDTFFIESLNPNKTANYVVKSVEKMLKLGHDLRDILVLSPMKKGYAGIEYLNEVIRDCINPEQANKKEITYQKQVFRVGDKIMYTTNNRDLDVYNGDIGVITKIKYGTNEIIADIDGEEICFPKDEWKNLLLAYAMTIHKAQGGQAKVVITVLSDEHDIMLTRNLFYTAPTRAEKIHVLVGSKQAALKAISNNRVRQRKTTLRARIEDIRKYTIQTQCN